jgi:hypothetical protein
MADQKQTLSSLLNRSGSGEDDGDVVVIMDNHQPNPTAPITDKVSPKSEIHFSQPPKWKSLQIAAILASMFG